jgi:regulator of protease activity HflC (stomatin/prohibitin superfamily)
MVIPVLMTIIAVIIFIFGIRIIRPTHRGVVERLGKYIGFSQPGFYWIIPVIETMRQRNITERLFDVQPQDIITKDNLNARVDLQVYAKVKNTEEDIKKSYYAIEDYKTQIIALAQTTARNVIGDMKFVEVNSQRNELNRKLAEIMEKEIAAWGVEIIRVELKEITPPKDVQETMNKVIKAQNERDAAVDFATAQETQADGLRRASIKQAEGIKQAAILEAQGKSEAIRLVNEAAQKYFKAEAKELKQLEVVESSLKNNAKIILTKEGINPSIILGSLPVNSLPVNSLIEKG